MENRAESVFASQIAGQLYESAPRFARLKQQLRPRICPFEELVPEIRQSGGRLLDFGCGAGLFGFHCLTRRYVDYVDGVDVDAAALVVANAAAANTLLADAIRFRLGSIPGTSYDAISMIDVMHHLDPKDQRPTFLDLCDRLAAGGVLIYKDMCIRPRWQAAANRLHDLVLSRQWIHYVPIDQVISWAEVRSGLTLERRSRFSYLVYGHELAVFRKRA